jgi:hypothetical protein
MSISDLFGLGLPRGSLMGAGQKEQEGQTNCESPAYRYYHQVRNKAFILLILVILQIFERVSESVIDIRLS